MYKEYDAIKKKLKFFVIPFSRCLINSNTDMEVVVNKVFRFKDTIKKNDKIIP